VSDGRNAAAALGVARASYAAMSKNEVKAQEDRIAASYKAAKARCDKLSANAEDIRMAEAKGGEKVASLARSATRFESVRANLIRNIAAAPSLQPAARVTPKGRLSEFNLFLLSGKRAHPAPRPAARNSRRDTLWRNRRCRREDKA
jgi:hypothetical protein